MGVKHPFTSLVADIGGPTYVQPTHWNSPHNTPPFKIADLAIGPTLASWVPASTASVNIGYEYYDNTPAQRQTFDFTYVDYITMGVGVASSLAGASTSMRLQYMPSGFPASWYSFDATGGSGPFVVLASNNNASIYLLGSNGPRLGATVTVSAAVKALPQPLTIRFAGFGGSGTYVGIGNADVFGF